MIAGQIEIQLMANIARLQRDMDRANQIISRGTAQIERGQGCTWLDCVRPGRTRDHADDRRIREVYRAAQTG